MGDKTAFVELSVDQFLQAETSGRKTKKTARKLARGYGPILDHFNDVIFLIDKAGRFVFVNKASERRTGIPAEKFIGRHFMELIDPQYHEFARGTFQKVMGGEKIPSVEMERQTASGEKITVEVNWTPIYKDGVAIALLGISRDVTERKQAREALKRARDELEMRVKDRTAELQEANELLKKQIKERKRADKKLKESEEKYRSLFENSGDAIFIADIETGKILDANRQAERLTGRSRQEIIGMHQSRLHSAQDADYYNKKFRKHIQNELVFDLEAEVVKKDGSVVPVFICSSLIDLQGKKVIQGIFRDISKEKMISDLKGELAARKLINRAKVIIANHYKINDSDAIKLLQQESRKQSRKLKEVAQAVVSSKFILD
ncbi:MAG: PAS domain S-box protein [Deltaproteobacteria bacterium]|nr:MAG: PAS domain S-box protein [Deltaproteobacteria bacterium]